MKKKSDSPPAADAPGYTIDGLAAASGVPSRTIRFYQSKGALMPPEIRGRVAYYGDEHIERLKLIGQLKDRGLRIRAITDLVGRVGDGDVDIAAWLGIEESMRAPWSDDSPELLSQAKLDKKMKGMPAGSLAELIEYGLVERRDDAFLVQSPGLLEVARKLHEIGVDVGLTADAGRVIQKHVGAMTRELAELFLDRAGRGFGDTPEGITKALAAVRTPAVQAVQLLFAKEMQSVLRQLIETGRTLDGAKRKGRSKRKSRR